MNKILLFLAACLPTVAFASGQARGIYVFPTAASLQNGDYEKAMMVKGVDGVAVLLDWSDLSTDKPGVYNFGPLAKYVALARGQRLKIELVIRAGRGTPAWLFDRGAKRLDFVFSHHGGVGVPQKFSMAPPWDEVFQRAFADLLQAVSGYLRQEGAMVDVAAVKISGINILSEELHLPSQTSDLTGQEESTDSIAIWQSVGYRPAKIQGAFDRLAAAYAAAFPEPDMVLAVIPRNAFPAIDDKGKAVSLGRARGFNHDLLVGMVSSAAQSFPGRFILQHDFLICGQPAEPTVMAMARNLRIPVAWQTNLYLGGQALGAAASGSPGHGVPLTSETFLTLLETGIHPERGEGPNAIARFIEVFPSDAIHFPEVVLRAHAELWAGADRSGMALP